MNQELKKKTRRFALKRAAQGKQQTQMLHNDRQLQCGMYIYKALKLTIKNNFKNKKTD